MMRALSSVTHRLCKHTPSRAFSSNHGDHGEHKKQEVAVTKHNPHAEKDLRGFENLDKLNENEKSYSPIHTTTADPFALYSFFSFLPNALARRVGKLVAHPVCTIASDSLHLPKTSENGVALYDSIEKASTYLTINKLWTRITPLLIVVALPQPTLATLAYGLISYVYYSTNWKIARNLVIRAELSPQTEELVYQKVTLFGELKTYRARISDLEATTLLQIFGENDHSEKSTRGLVNREVAFRVKSTNELLLFDKHGIWNQAGINHPLLV